MQRRRALLAAAFGIVSLGGCGFELRRAPELRFRSIAFTGFGPNSALADELRRQLGASPGTQLLNVPAQAQVVLQALADSRERSVVASTAAGQARELQLRARFSFRVHTPQGRELIAPTEILLSRDMSTSETVALAKELEEAALFRAMQSDIALQVMRRLASVPAI
jgi:LPS-assembly lipoprotein